MEPASKFAYIPQDKTLGLSEESNIEETRMCRVEEEEYLSDDLDDNFESVLREDKMKLARAYKLQLSSQSRVYRVNKVDCNVVKIDFSALENQNEAMTGDPTQCE